MEVPVPKTKPAVPYSISHKVSLAPATHKKSILVAAVLATDNEIGKLQLGAAVTVI